MTVTRVVNIDLLSELKFFEKEKNMRILKSK